MLTPRPRWVAVGAGRARMSLGSAQLLGTEQMSKEFEAKFHKRRIEDSK
jgi:hypothetical protein